MRVKLYEGYMPHFYLSAQLSDSVSLCLLCKPNNQMKKQWIDRWSLVLNRQFCAVKSHIPDKMHSSINDKNNETLNQALSSVL